MRLALKEYQRETLAALGRYAAACRRHMEAGRARPERDAFEEVTGRDYYRTPRYPAALQLLGCFGFTEN
jgi:hypothetical protein